MHFDRGTQGYRDTSPKFARGNNIFDQGHKDTGILAQSLRESNFLTEGHSDTGTQVVYSTMSN